MLHLLKDARKLASSDAYRQTNSASPLAHAMWGKAEGEIVSFGGVDCIILRIE